METLAAVKNDKNVSVVQSAFDNFLKGNIKDIADVCTEDVQWGSFNNPDIPYASVYHGKKGVAEFFSNLAGSIDYENFEPSRFYSDNDMVFVVGNHKATVKSTGKKFGHDFLMQFRLRDGKVSNFFAWVDSRDQAQAFSASSTMGAGSGKTAIIQNLFALFGKGDIPGIIDHLSENVEWNATNPFLPKSRMYRGKNEVLSFFEEVAKSMNITVFEPQNYYESGNTVYVNGRFEVESKIDKGSNGQGMRKGKVDWTMRWRFTGDKVSEFTEYFAPVE